MTGFALDENGDVILENGEIRMVSVEELIRQTVQSVLGTNKGEWFLNINEGIDYSAIFERGASDEVIRNEICAGLIQIDGTFVLDQLQIRRDAKARCLSVAFTAHNKDGKVIKGEKQWD